MKKSTWRKFFSKSRSKSSTRASKKQKEQIPLCDACAGSTPVTVENLCTEHKQNRITQLTQNFLGTLMKAEQPQSPIAADTKVASKRSPNYEKNVQSDSSKPALLTRTSTNEEFMTEEVESQNMSDTSRTEEISSTNEQQITSGNEKVDEDQLTQNPIKIAPERDHLSSEMTEEHNTLNVDIKNKKNMLQPEAIFLTEGEHVSRNEHVEPSGHGNLTTEICVNTSTHLESAAADQNIGAAQITSEAHNESTCVESIGQVLKGLDAEQISHMPIETSKTKYVENQSSSIKKSTVPINADVKFQPPRGQSHLSLMIDEREPIDAFQQSRNLSGANNASATSEFEAVQRAGANVMGKIPTSETANLNKNYNKTNVKSVHDQQNEDDSQSNRNIFSNDTNPSPTVIFSRFSTMDQENEWTSPPLFFGTSAGFQAQGLSVNFGGSNQESGTTRFESSSFQRYGIISVTRDDLDDSAISQENVLKVTEITDEKTLNEKIEENVQYPPVLDDEDQDQKLFKEVKGNQ